MHKKERRCSALFAYYELRGMGAESAVGSTIESHPYVAVTSHRQVYLPTDILTGSDLVALFDRYRGALLEWISAMTPLPALVPPHLELHSHRLCRVRLHSTRHLHDLLSGCACDAAALQRHTTHLRLQTACTAACVGGCANGEAVAQAAAQPGHCLLLRCVRSHRDSTETVRSSTHSHPRKSTSLHSVCEYNGC